jgi:copper transport protein
MNSRRRACLAAFLAFAGIVLLAPVGAEAHAILLASTPPIGSVSPTAPARIELLFSERVSLPPQPVRLTLAASGEPVLLGNATTRDGGRLVSAVLPRGDRHVRGVVIVSWRVISDDGDPVSGAFQIAIGEGHPGALQPPGLADTLPAPSRIAAQWLTIGGITLAILGTWLAMIAGGALATRFAILGAALAALGRLVLFAELAAGSSLSTSLASRAGLAAALALLCFAACAALARAPWFARALLILGAFATAAGGHGPTVEPLLVGTLVFGSHLLAGTAWLATLGGLLLISTQRRRVDQRAVTAALRVYVKIAAACVAALVASGVAMAWLLVGSAAALTSTTDGRFVIAKSALLQAALLIALRQRQRLDRHLHQGLERLAGLEWPLLGAATLLGGVMADTLPGSSQAAASQIATTAPTDHARTLRRKDS